MPSRHSLIPLFAFCALATTVAGQGATQGNTDFTLRPGDKIEVMVLRDTTLSGLYPVDERGRAVLPLLGARVVTATPWASLRDSLLADLGRQLNDPGLRLTPMRRVFVLGFVQEPGVYYADPTTPIAGAIAMAGGASTEGNLRSIRVLRDGAALFERVSIEDPRVLQDVRSGDQIFVARRGWFDRNSPFFVSAMVGLAGIAVTLIISQ
jgi:protein involved in polysaccharide export with SLBB domain